jgi:hypothetical protein
MAAMFSERLPCSVTEFYTHFISDKAGFSDKDKHVAAGHSEVEVEEWCKGADEGMGMFRSGNVT